MRQRIRLGVCDFWPGYRTDQCRIINLLRQRFDIELCATPDFLLYSAFGAEHYRHKCVRIFYSGEARPPDWDECDYAFTFEHTRHPRHYRLPLYAVWGPLESLLKRGGDASAMLHAKTKFCNFVFSNPRCATRNRFFDMLSRYKRVDAGGAVRNNLGYRVQNKMEFIRDYKFTIAFENRSYPGYTTEKLAQPMWAGSLPIYWGNPLVHLDFNPRSFINGHDYASLDALVERVIEVDQSDELYLAYVRQPWFHGNRVPDALQRDHLLDQFERIFNTPLTPMALRRPLSLQRHARIGWRRTKHWIASRVLPEDGRTW